MKQFDNPAVMTEEGVFVGDNWLRLNEILQDMGQNLELRWIPPQNRENAEKSRPYAIVHCPPDKPEYVVMFAGEQDNPTDILARIWSGNTRRNNVLGTLEAKEAAEAAFKAKEEIEKAEEAADLFHFLATDRSKYFSRVRDKNGKLVTLDTQYGSKL